MSTNHFNGLTEAEAERLAILAEECGEVIQATMKILRHGYFRKDPDAAEAVTGGAAWENNRESLERELVDLSHAMRRMEIEGDVNAARIVNRAASKPERIKAYLHHQPESE